MAEVGWSADAILQNCLIDAEAAVSRANIKPAYWTKLAIQAGSGRAVFDAIAAIASLQKWARAVAKAERVRRAAQIAAPDPDNTSAETWLIAYELPRIYKRNFGEFTISHDSATYGRGVAFVSACLREIADVIPERNPAAIAKLIERRRRMPIEQRPRKRRDHRPKRGDIESANRC